MFSSASKLLILIQCTTIFCAVLKYSANAAKKTINVQNILNKYTTLVDVTTADKVAGITIPQLSRKCKISDSSCIKAVAQDVLPVVTAGMPELATKPLDEMYVDKNIVDLAGLKLTISDAYIKGLKNAVIKHISFDTAKNVLNIVYTTDMDMKSKYVASGQLLVLPISGKGDMKINLKILEVELNMPFDVVKNKDGKDTVELKNYKFKFDVKGGAHFDLTNLFNGDKRLSTALLKFMNENWKLLSDTFGRPMLNRVHKEIFEAIKTYLRSAPMDQLFDN